MHPVGRIVVVAMIPSAHPVGRMAVVVVAMRHRLQVHSQQAIVIGAVLGVSWHPHIAAQLSAMHFVTMAVQLVVKTLL